MFRISLLAIALSLTACNNGKDTDTGPTGDDTDTPSGVTDADNDGYYAEVDDCNDDNAAVNPAATEACDGFDNNCDGLIDDSSAVGTLEFYPDADGDTYGDDSASATYACSTPSGYVSNNLDCNDDDAAYNPAASEIDCEDPNDYNCDGSVGFDDADNDGYAACEDCQDDDPDIHPDADEVCGNAIDDDCDLLVDDDDPEPGVGATTWYLDADGDGFGRDATKYIDVACDQPPGWVADNTDCNDLDPTAYPDADEVCDGQDTNCNGDIDENSAVDAETWYYDGDEDGFGDVNIIQLACYEPTDYLADSSDCDDSDGAVNPDALELCATDGVDDDCDGSADESTADDASLWYEDADGDDYGHSGRTVYACDEPANYASVAGDCNDTVSSLNPGETEYCDELDNDCDGTIDESGAADADIWYADNDGDGYGDPDISEPNCYDPPNFVSDFTDCEDSDGAINPGEEEICNDGTDNDCDGDFSNCEMDLTNADTSFLGQASNHLAGGSVAYAGDVDGDGSGDLLIASNGAEFSGSTLGAVYMYYGPLAASGSVSLSTADAVIVGDTTGDKIGKTVDGGHDIDGDGLDDFILSTAAPSEICNTSTCLTVGSAESGATYVFYDALTGSADVTAADAAFVGEASYDRAGVSAMIGDMDGDGNAEFAIGANANDDTGSAAGIIYVIHGPASGLNNLNDADIKITGEVAGDKLGQEMTAVGDINGDGVADLLASTIDAYSDVGAAYVFYGPIASGTMSAGDADVILTGVYAGDAAGNSIGSAGDQDGDGNDDFLVGVSGDDDAGSSAGAVYLVHGPGTSGDLSTSTVKFTGVTSNWGLGSAADGSGDVDGDGNLDILLGASGGGYSDQGEAYLMFGPVAAGTHNVEDADATMTGDAAGDGAGVDLVLTGDIDGSGQASILIGANGDNEAGTDAGAAYLILGIGL